MRRFWIVSAWLQRKHREWDRFVADWREARDWRRGR
jgi:hypothetical protein